MPFVEIFLIAFGLSMDSLAVSIAAGTCSCKRKIHYRSYLKIALFMGFFQGFMPLLGWLLGTSFAEQISSIDHWIAFLLLVFIGGKMVWEGVKGKEKDRCINFSSNKTFLVLALATSIDALAVGVSFAMLNIEILRPIIVIGLFTFVISFLGTIFGHKLGHKVNLRIEIIGGLILVGVGTKILLEHLL